MINNKQKKNRSAYHSIISPRMLRNTLIIFVVAAGIALSLMRYAAKDETGFLIEAATMSDCLLEGRWFGNEAVGWHGFIFKIPAAILFTIFGRSIFLATLTNIIIAALSCWLCFNLLRKVLKSTVWAFAGTWLVITTYHFIICLPTFLRDIPVMFTVLLLLHAIINKSNKWIIGLCMLLILDAKEGVFFALVPGFVIWVIISELCSRREGGKTVVSRTEDREQRTEDREPRTEDGEPSTKHQVPSTKHQALSTKNFLPREVLLHRGDTVYHGFLHAAMRLFSGLIPAFVFLILMFCTSIIPLNMLDATILGVTTSGMHDIKYNFSFKRAVRSIKSYKNDKKKNIAVKPRAEDRKPRTEDRDPKTENRPKLSGCFARTEDPVPSTQNLSLRENLLHLGSTEDRESTGGVDSKQLASNGIVLDSTGRKVSSKKSDPGGVKNSTGQAKLGAESREPKTDPGGVKDSTGQAKNQPRWSKRLHGASKEQKTKPPVFLIYLKKIIFPRTFSFIAMPKIIVFPALFMSVVMFRRFWKGGMAELLALPILLWSYMVIYIIRESHGRYLMPVLPFLALFFAFFMIEGLKKKWFSVIVLIISALLIGFGFMFEIKFAAVKIGFNVILFSFMILALIGYRKKWRHRKLFALAVPLFSGVFSIGTALASSLTQSDGQLRSFFRYGYNMEIEKVVAEFKPKEKFWLNGFGSGYVMWFYMDERLTNGERTWRLAEWVPKKKLLRRYDDNQHRRIGTRIRSMKRFKKAIMTNNVTKVGMVISTHPKQKFSYQNKLNDLYKADWLEFERTVQFKNKKLFIFNVNR